MNVKSKNQQGFSLIEIMISVGVLTVISLGVAYNVTGLFNSQKKLANTGEAQNFANSILDFVGTDSYCESELIGRPVPGKNKRNVTLTGLGGAGTTKGTVKAGDALNSGVRVRELTVVDKSLVKPIQVFDGGKNLNLRVLRFSLGMQVKDPNNRGAWQEMPVKTVDVPVLASGGRVRVCGTRAGVQPQLVCASIGRQYDAKSKTCKPASACKVRGTYVMWTCTPSHPSCGGDVVEEVKRVGASLFSHSWKHRILKGANKGGIKNPITKKLSCPKRSTAELSGKHKAMFDVSCGKKCSQKIEQNTHFYVCMECN